LTRLLVSLVSVVNFLLISKAILLKSDLVSLPDFGANNNPPTAPAIAPIIPANKKLLLFLLMYFITNV